MKLHFCDICGQQLTDPQSIERGMGKVCAERAANPSDKKNDEKQDAAGD